MDTEIGLYLSYLRRFAASLTVWLRMSFVAFFAVSFTAVSLAVDFGTGTFRVHLQ